MSTPSAFDTLARIVGEALSPFATRLHGNQAELTMEQLGLRLPLSAGGVTRGLQSAAAACSQLPAVVASVIDASESGDDHALVSALKNLSESLVHAGTTFAELSRALDEVIQNTGSLTPGQKANLHGVVEKLPHRLLHLALISYIEERQPAVKSALELAGLFDDTPIDTDPTDPSLSVHHRKEVRFDRIPQLFSNPIQHLKTLYGFGNPGFDGLELFRRIKQMVDRPDAEAFIIEAPGLPAILEAWRFRLEVVPGATPALRVRLRVPAQKDLDISEPIAGPWLGTVISSARFEGGIELLLHPTQGLKIDPPASAASIDMAMGLKAETPDNSPMILFGRVGGSRIELQRFALRLPLKLMAASRTPSPFVEVGAAFELKQGKVVIDGAQADGFLAQILPTGGATIPFDLEGGWSVRQGLYFKGETGLDATIPVNINLSGVAKIDSLQITLEGREGPAQQDSAIHAVIATTMQVTIGPVSVMVERFGLQAAFTFPRSGGNLGVADLSLGFRPPTGLGLAIEAAGVTGGGFLGFDPQRAEYSGMLQLELAETIAIKALGLLTTKLPDGSRGYSLVILLTAEGFAPIPIGLGFTLTGIGGLVALHRTVRTDVLRDGLKTGTLNSILFPTDPLRNVPQIFSDLRRIFPPTAGRHVFGPMVQLRWGSPTLLTLDLALLVELPAPIRVIVLGRLQVLLPDQSHPLVQIRMDALGVLDVSAETVALDATLYDSKILQFTLTGDMALRAGWGRQPQFVLAIGGFHPRFAPPPGLPALKRLALQLADGDSLQLRCQAYLAVTSNTVQFGARVDLHAAGGGFSFDGMLGFDAILQLAPLAFEVEVGAALALRYHGRLLMGISFKGRLAGPTPWQVEGKAKISLLFFSVSVSFSRTFGSKVPPPLPAAVDVIGLIAAALADRRNWSGTVPRSSSPVVTIRETPPPASGLRVHPWAEVTLRERIAPLNRRLTKVGTAPLVGGPTTVTVTVTDRAGAAPWRTTPVQEPFALAQYEDLREDEQLSQPAFVPLAGGLTVAADDVAVDDEAGLTAPIAYETVLIDPTRPPERPKAGYVLSAAVLTRVARFGAAGQAPARKRRQMRTAVTM